MPIDFLNRVRGGGSASFYDFTLGALPAGVSFTRASTGWRFNSAGLIVPEVTDVSRFQYDPAMLTARGLLLEDAATNVTPYSEQLDHASWGKVKCSVTANGAVAPDGTTTMDKMVEDNTLGTHDLTRSYSYVAGNTYTTSLFGKAAERRYVQVAFVSNVFGGVGTQRVIFDLLAGTIFSSTALVTVSIQAVGGGIFRCAASCLATSSNAQPQNISISSDGTATNYTGDGVSGLYLWGVQTTSTDSVSSYIPTGASTVTRAADVALITNPLALADQCWIVKGRTPSKIAGGAVNVAFQVDDGTTGNNRRIIYGTDGKLHVIATVGGVDQCDLDLGTIAADTNFAVAARFADNNFAASLNGGAIVTDTSGANPLGLTTVRLGRRGDGYAWNSTLRSLKHQSTATDAELPLLAA